MQDFRFEKVVFHARLRLYNRIAKMRNTESKKFGKGSSKWYQW
jgi:hypothetical protein